MSTSADQFPQVGFEAHERLITGICDHLRASKQGDSTVICRFTKEFFARVPRPLVAGRSLAELAALTKGAFDFLERTTEGKVEVEVLNPEEEGWGAPITVIRVEVADRPFIVDTIREYLDSENLPIQQYAYPVIGVDRDPSGRIVAISPPTRANAQAVVHCEVPRIDDPSRRAAICEGILSRLHDVVAATDDFPQMLAAVDAAAEIVSGYADSFPDRAAEFMEIDDFLEWLRDGHFVFLGYREYEIVEQDGTEVLRVEPASGLGILRDEDKSSWASGVPLTDVPEELRRRVTDGPVLITTKTNAVSTVHRRARMDYIGIKRLAPDGTVIGEFRFLGLFTSNAYGESAEGIPILRKKLAEVLQRLDAVPGSHDYKEIITIFNSIPREDLFQASTTDLTEEIQSILSLLFSDEVQVSLRQDPHGRGLSVMIVLPRGRFSGEVRQRIQDALRQRFHGEVLDYHLAMGAGDQARLHFHVASTPQVASSVDAGDVAADVRLLIRSWDDRLHDQLAERVEHGEARRLVDLYGPAFSDEYRAATLPEIALQDVESLEALRREGKTVTITIRAPREGESAEKFRDLSVLKLYLIGQRLILSDFMPILDNAGLRVIEVTPFTVSGDGLPEAMIYSFAVQDPEAGRIPAEREGVLGEALLAIRAGDTTSDPFNVLVLRAGLRWREVDVLRTYANFAFQAGMVPTRFATARALAKYSALARLLLDLFEVRFNPARAGDGVSKATAAIKALRIDIASALEKVTTLSDDRALRRLANLIEATVRTNYFRYGAADPTRRSGGVPYISIKIRSGDVEELRRARLLFELYVYSSKMEGVHLRGSSVSRGGIRWSDRPDDYRTEVLGLATTQIEKNAVIVPSGSKGGFILKGAPEERSEMLTQVTEQYRTLIRGMLDLTDNIVAGKVVPPPDVVCYDEPDPYLVVAADKGTSHLSDTANGVAGEYGFWLGDAFASGGSKGYDHKKEGITARGAWECVKRHFREMEKDIQTESFTVVGIGDMSGDVFGNGMLLSRQIRLVAAFDHRNIFIDPDPDAEASFQERARLFGLERSSWEDYDRSKLSEGAMIVPRASKEVALTPQARSALGLEEDVQGLDGESLVQAVLKAPVELLWNGGIGTYVKSREETNGEAGDTTNDAVRVDAAELRCKVIGEGGNLGMTQRARVEYAMQGGRLNTDAIDNSAGVDMSDHEVNLKILLGASVSSGKMSSERRDALLEEFTDDVSRLVLHNNIEQSLAVSLDEARSRDASDDFASLISALERDRLVDRAAEGIPASHDAEEGGGKPLRLTRPTLCVLLARAKLQAKSQLLASGLPDQPAAEKFLIEYFPAGAVEAVGMKGLREHRLRREIITTELVNDVVGLMGASFLHRVSRELGRPLPEVATAWLVASELAGTASIGQQLEALEATFPSATIYRWRLGLARVLDRTTRWLLGNVSARKSIHDAMPDLVEGLARLQEDFPTIVTGEDRTLFEQLAAELKQAGFDQPLAQKLVTLRFLPGLLDVLRLARRAKLDPLRTAEAYYLVADHFGFSWLRQLLRTLPQTDAWGKRFAQRLAADLLSAQGSLAEGVLKCEGKEPSVESCLAKFEEDHPAGMAIYKGLMDELRMVNELTLPAIAVGVRALTDLAER